MYIYAIVCDKYSHFYCLREFLCMNSFKKEIFGKSVSLIDYSSIEGFRSWYYLQHSDTYNPSNQTDKRKYKPFVTNFSIKEEIKEKI